MKTPIFSLIVILFVCTFTGTAMAGDYGKIFKEAEEHFISERYGKALPLYLALDSMRKENHNTNFKIGLCYLRGTTTKTKAIPYLEFAVQKVTTRYYQGAGENKAPSSAWYYLGQAYHLNYEFDKARTAYERYKTFITADNQAEMAETTHDIASTQRAKEYVKSPVKVTINNLGNAINSPMPDYSPVVLLDESGLMFTTRREGGINPGLEADGYHFEDIYESTRQVKDWGYAGPLGGEINSFGHEATVNISADGQKLIIYRDDNGNGNLYMSQLRGVEWTTPEFMGGDINTDAWESHGSLTGDNKVFYFVSDRQGGIGNRDIYRTELRPDGSWTPATNLGNVINTPYDEDGVVVHPDGKTLYFASKGHTTMGGFDIFTSTLGADGKWSTPVNMGYPVNTPDDDVFFVPTADGKRAYFSSVRENGVGEKDIYMLEFSPDTKEKDVAVITGLFTSCKLDSNAIVIRNAKTNEVINTYTANTSTGKFSFPLTAGMTYKVSFMLGNVEKHVETVDVPEGKGYLFIQREVPCAEPITAFGKKDTATTAVAVAPKDTATATGATATTAMADCQGKNTAFETYFNYNVKAIDVNSEDFRKFIEPLALCVKDKGSIEIEIESSASQVPTSTYGTNERLAKARAEEAKNRVTKALAAKGIKQVNIQVKTVDAKVQGPEYSNDSKDKEKYEKFQFVKIKATVKL